MNLDPGNIYKVLKGKNIIGLYHANTVRTSKTFLEQGGLLSRNYVENNDLVQTPQKSDNKDKDLGIYDGLFLDSINISDYFVRYNKYGPILFRFNLELLLGDEVESLSITKKNPINWRDNDSEEDRFFKSAEEFDEKFKTGNKVRDGGCHLIIRNSEEKLSFNHLYGIQIDNPGLTYTDEKEEKKPIYEGVKIFFSDDIEKNEISWDKIYVKNKWYLKSQYKVLNRFYKKEFKRLFSRNI